MTAITEARAEILANAAVALSAAKANPGILGINLATAQEAYDEAFQRYTNPFQVSKWV